MFEFICAIGGSETTRKVLPAFGFKEVAQTWEAARPLRPLQQALTHQTRNWKLPARLARNLWWALNPSLPVVEGWAIEEVAPDQVAAIETTHFFARTRGFFEYLAACPTAGFRLFSLTRRGEPAGYALVSLIRGQARLAGLWLSHASEESWRATLVLAQKVAHSTPGAYEFIAKGVSGTAENAAIAAGLRIVAKAPVFVLNKKGAFTPPSEFQYQLIDDDGAFLDIGRANYLT
jgi:hypothetical protein